MKQIWKGKLKLRIAHECPYYATDAKRCEKVLFYHWGWSISLWTYHDEPCQPEFSDWAINKLSHIFPGCTISHANNTICTANGEAFWPADVAWIFSDKYELSQTCDPCVLYDSKNKKYIGFSHRGHASFGIGDMLFDANIKDVSLYYKQPKYRWKYLMTLLKYHLKGDAAGFEDLCEDDIIGHGIMQIVPFKELGNKRIKTDSEAFEAARNFAKYIS